MGRAHLSRLVRNTHSQTASIIMGARQFRTFVDFDGTLTHSDTLAVLGTIQPAASRPAPCMSWEQIVDAYIGDFSPHTASYLPRKEDRRTLGVERKWLASLAPIESRSVQRVQDAGTFKGVTTHDVECTARTAVEEGRIRLRNGWQRLVTSDSDVSVLSVNWSRTFIRAVLQAGANQVAGQSQCQLGKAIAKLDIHANEISNLERMNGSDGVIEGSIRTSADKMRVFKEIAGRTDHSSSEGSPRVVYIGDSNTDLECLVEAEIGICMRDKPMRSGQKELAETLERLEIDVKPLNAIDDEPEEKDSRTLFWASDFKDMGRVLGTED